MPYRRTRATVPRNLSRRSMDRLLEQYASNLPRHLIGVAQAAARPLVQACAADSAQPASAAAIQMTLRLAEPGTRIIDLARHAGITQQAAGQLVRQLERRGLALRAAHARDRRVHELKLTARGRRFLGAARGAERRLERHLGKLLGAGSFAAFRRDCLRLFNTLVVTGQSGSEPLASGAVGALSLALAGLSVYCERTLMERTQARGYPALKMSFSQVLTHLSPHGALISDLASRNGVSKQAISQVVRELEDLGYIERRERAGDRRSTLIFLTERGLDLIRASLANIAALEVDFARVLGRRRAVRFAATLRRLFEEFEYPVHPAQRVAAQSRCAQALRAALERLYVERGEDIRPPLFVRDGSGVRLSMEALRILAKIELRIGS